VLFIAIVQGSNPSQNWDFCTP